MRPAWSLAVPVVLAACSAHDHGSQPPPGDGGAGDAAGLAAPRLVAPVSVSFLTSRLPVFRWKLPPGADGARVEVCADRGCSSVVTSFDAVGDHGSPPADLPAGVVFWRARAMLAGAPADAATAPWETVLPRVDAPVTTAWGSMVDGDGDGYADVVAGDSDPNAPTSHVYVHRGSATGPSDAPSTVLTAPAPSIFWAASVASAGDFDGDGFGDLLVGSPGEDTVYLYRGGTQGFAAAGTLKGTAGSGFGSSVSGAGDVDGDGYADVVVGAPQLPTPGSPVLGGATVFYGSPAGPSPQRTATLGPRAGSNAQGLGNFVSEAGDVDGDGLADVAVWEGIETSNPQYVLVYLGKAQPFGGAPSALLQYDGASVSWIPVATLLACAGDVNGDGYADLVMGTAVDPGSGFTSDHVSVFAGGPGGPTPLPWRRADTTLASGDVFGISVGGMDLDQDGFSDLAVGTAVMSPPGAAAVLYRGSAAGIALSETLTTTDATLLYERPLVSPGDVDGDGYPDLLVGFPSRTAMLADAGAPPADGGSRVLHGAVEVHPGGPSGASASARWTLRPPDGTSVAYGATLAHP